MLNHPPKIRCRGVPVTTREADTSDEDDDGILDASLNYENPLWKLQFSRSSGHRSIECFNLMISYLGRPP